MARYFRRYSWSPVLLRAVVGLDAKSAAQVAGKRAGAIRTAAYRGLKTLANRLDRDLFMPNGPASWATHGQPKTVPVDAAFSGRLRENVPRLIT